MDRHCMTCDHDFDEIWPAEDAAWVDPATCPKCGSDDTLLAG